MINKIFIKYMKIEYFWKRGKKEGNMQNNIINVTRV